MPSTVAGCTTPGCPYAGADGYPSPNSFAPQSDPALGGGAVSYPPPGAKGGGGTGIDAETMAALVTALQGVAAVLAQLSTVLATTLQAQGGGPTGAKTGAEMITPGLTPGGPVVVEAPPEAGASDQLAGVGLPEVPVVDPGAGTTLPASASTALPAETAVPSTGVAVTTAGSVPEPQAQPSPPLSAGSVPVTATATPTATATTTPALTTTPQATATSPAFAAGAGALDGFLVAGDQNELALLAGTATKIAGTSVGATLLGSLKNRGIAIDVVPDTEFQARTARYDHDDAAAAFVSGPGQTPTVLIPQALYAASQQSGKDLVAHYLVHELTHAAQYLSGDFDSVQYEQAIGEAAANAMSDEQARMALTLMKESGAEYLASSVDAQLMDPAGFATMAADRARLGRNMEAAAAFAWQQVHQDYNPTGVQVPQFVSPIARAIVNAGVGLQ